MPPGPESPIQLSASDKSRRLKRRAWLGLVAEIVLIKEKQKQKKHLVFNVLSRALEFFKWIFKYSILFCLYNNQHILFLLFCIILLSNDSPGV